MTRTGIILCGPSGSGKTTTRRKFSEAGDFTELSSDDILLGMAAEEGLSYQEAYALHQQDSERLFRERLNQAMAEGRSVIIDRTNLTPEKRAGFVGELKRAGYEVIGAGPDLDPHSETGRTELLARAAARTDRGAPMPAHVIEAQIAAFTPPSFSEGYDRIISFDDDPHPGQSLTI